MRKYCIMMWREFWFMGTEIPSVAYGVFIEYWLQIFKNFPESETFPASHSYY